MSENGAGLTPDPKLVGILADMVEAAMRRDSGQRVRGVECVTKGARRNGGKS